MDALILDRYKIAKPILWIIIGICVLPLLLNLIGVDFGTVTSKLNPYKITKSIELEQQEGVKDILLGRNFHTIFVAISIAIAFLTAILALIDFRIKGDVSTPIVGIALFCSGLLDLFHMLVSTHVIEIPHQQFYITSYTWFFCRTFHAGILIMGTSIFLLRSDLLLEESKRNARRFIANISFIFIALTVATIVFLLVNSNIPRVVYPFRNISRSYDLIPLALYLIAAFYVFPRFYEKHPSVFSQTLIYSVIPAIATQLYMAFGSNELFDNNFNIAHFMMAFTYFIPFVGLGLNYLQTHKNEQQVILKLDKEAAERKHTQEILSGVLNSSLSSIMGLNAIRNSEGRILDFKFILLNPASEIIFDPMLSRSFDHVIGKNLTDELPFSREEGWVGLFEDVIISGMPLNYEYYSANLKKWLFIIAVKLDDGLAVTISDISKRKNALKELVDSEKLAVTGRIARTIAHEVRNPLTNINMSLEQLREEVTHPNDSVQMYFEIIKRNSDRINQLITELLNSSRPARLEMQNYSVNRLLDETLELAFDRIHLKKINLEKKLDSTIPQLMLDAPKMKTALLNIIINAVEAMEEGKGVLSVQSHKADSQCLIEIMDNGCGISKENLGNLFDPFFSKRDQGMGLGLFATQNIIRTHKGDVSVESDIGKGTKFTISLGI